MASERPARRRPVLRFILLFAACMAVFYAITLSPAFQRGPFQAYLRVNAVISAAILDVLGEQASVTGGATIVARHYSLQIARGCDAIEPSALFAAAVIALPVAMRRRLIGLAVGIPVLLAINLLRIVSLYYAGAHWPAAFETLHVTVWQPLFVLLAMAGWMAWALWATRAPGPAQRSATASATAPKETAT